MNKLFKLLLVGAVLVSATPAFAYDSPTYDTYTNKSEKIGKQGNPVRVVKLVRFSSQGHSMAALSSGEVVVYDTISDDGVSVRRTTTSADGAIAGVMATTAPSADAGSTTAQDDAGRRNWGWIVVHGPATINTGVGGTNGSVAGSPFVTSRDGGMATSLENMITVDAAGVTNYAKAASNKGGFFMDTAGTDTTDPQEDVFVRLE